MTDREQLDLVRKRLAVVEEAAADLLEVFDRTGKERLEAVGKLVAALQSDFKTAIVSSPDMSDQDRAEWLDKS